MRILYLTQWFDPEPNVIKGLAFVRALEVAGHDVTVVTGLPNYPTGKLYPGYRVRLVQQEAIEGVRVVRLPLYPSHDRSSLRRSLNYLSFFASALIYWLFRRRRFDLAYVYHPPITVGLAAALAGMVRPLRFVLDVQDLWPDTLASTGMPGGAALGRLIGPLCKLVYRRATAIVVQSDGMKRALVDQGVPAGKISTILNWADVPHLPPLQPVRGQGPFTVVYGGNLGRAQGLQALISAAAIVERTRSDIRIRIYGDGVDADDLRRATRETGVMNLSFEGRCSSSEMVDVFSKADALVMHLAGQPLFSITIPSKTQFYLAMGRPIVAAVAGDAARLLQRSGAALIVDPDNREALAKALCAMAEMPAAERQALGASGRHFYLDHLSFERGMHDTIRLIERAAGSSAGRLMTA